MFMFITLCTSAWRFVLIICTENNLLTRFLYSHNQNKILVAPFWESLWHLCVIPGTGHLKRFKKLNPTMASMTAVAACDTGAQGYR